MQDVHIAAAQAACVMLESKPGPATIPDRLKRACRLMHACRAEDLTGSVKACKVMRGHCAKGSDRQGVAAARTSAASSARFLPVATPTPSMAVPELHMMAFTSAKSTLTRPGMVMMSEMPCTPCCRHIRQ